GVLVVHDVYGLTDHILDVSRRFAEEGFVALAPDLYYRFPTRTAPYDDVATAGSLRQQVSDAQVMDDLYTAFRLLAARGEVRSGLVGAVGYGAGGRDAFMLAARYPDVLAVISYYGSLAPDDPSAPIQASAKLEAPSLLFFGEADDVISAAEVDRVRDALTQFG